jgi:predicted dehydrogenase
MPTTPRRTFLQGAGLAAAAWALPGQSARAAEPRPVTVAVIGTGGMGSNHVRLLSARKDVRIAALCDVDGNRLAAAAQIVQSATGAAPQTVADLRRVLDDKSIEAVWIATPDHWHAPAAILALAAGKHVYVEKPCCHNVREGRLLVEAVQRSGKHLQVGTQTRSSPVPQEAIEQLRSGKIGEILVAKAWNSQKRGSIGHQQSSEPPAHLDFDLWVGPAPMVPYRANLLPGIWRWWYDFGCGDIGNDGVHDIDVALWGLGVATHPSTAACLGGKSFFDDDQQFPDTQYAVFQYAAADGERPKQLIFEQRIWSPYTQEGYENGVAFYGTEGLMLIGHTTGWKLYGPRNKLFAERSGGVDLAAHHTNFLDCVRGSQSQLNTHVNADVAAGHRAATICHLANIAARTRRTLQFDPQTEQIADDPPANALLHRQYREDHWAIPQGV